MEKTLNRVLLEGAPSVTLSTKQHGNLRDDYELVVDMESPQDTRVRAIQDFVLKFQDKIKSSGIKDFTTQLGNLTLTQKVGYSFRIYDIGDASPFYEGRTDDLIRSLTQEFPRYLVQSVVGPSKPKRVIIYALVTLTISRQGAGGRTAGTVRTAGNTTFENVVWIPSVREAFHTVRSEELKVHGHREGYPGHIGGKHTWQVRSDDIMTEAQARAFANKDVNNNNTWDQAAFALRLTKERVLATDKVTVTVTARDEKEALRQANMRIYATGRIPPKAVVKTSELTSKKVAETPRTVTLEVTGTRKIVADGVTDGWMFYGWVKE